MKKRQRGNRRRSGPFFGKLPRLPLSFWCGNGRGGEGAKRPIQKPSKQEAVKTPKIIKPYWFLLPPPYDPANNIGKLKSEPELHKTKCSIMQPEQLLLILPLFSFCRFDRCTLQKRTISLFPSWWMELRPAKKTACISHAAIST